MNVLMLLPNSDITYITRPYFLCLVQTSYLCFGHASSGFGNWIGFLQWQLMEGAIILLPFVQGWLQSHGLPVILVVLQWF
jgi:hypothetical protein